MDGLKIANAVPAVSGWLAGLQGDTKKKAERWIGRLNTIRSQDDNDKKELLKASILAFESYRRKEELGQLEMIKDEGLDHILKIFHTIDDLELSYYGQIVSLRVGVIKALKDKIKVNDKELVLRDYIFDHLWLLDPSWERTKGTEHAETLVSTFLNDNTASLKGNGKKARVDIGYRAAGGKHVIIELKRASVSVPVDDLMKQVRKYRDGTKRILEKTIYKGWPIENCRSAGNSSARMGGWVRHRCGWRNAESSDGKCTDSFYDELLTNAQQAYADYLEEHIKLDKLWDVFQAIDDFAPATKP
jgi:hypothetical protein